MDIVMRIRGSVELELEAGRWKLVVADRLMSKRNGLEWQSECSQRPSVEGNGSADGQTADPEHCDWPGRIQASCAHGREESGTPSAAAYLLLSCFTNARR